MLAIQPVSMKSYSQGVAFGNTRREALEDEKRFYEEQKMELEGLLDDERIPKNMKKAIKVANVVTDGIIAGISVACATIAGAKFGKDNFTKVASSGFVKNTVKNMEPLKKYASSGLEFIAGAASKGADKAFDTKYGKKVLEFFKNITSSKLGEKVINFAKKVAGKVVKFVKGLNPFKSEEAYDKAAQKTATILGIGSGTAGAYATAVRNAQEQEGEIR